MLEVRATKYCANSFILVTKSLDFFYVVQSSGCSAHLVFSKNVAHSLTLTSALLIKVD